MRVSKEHVPATTVVHIELTEEEASILRALLGSICGKNSVTTRLRDRLAEAGVQSAPGYCICNGKDRKPPFVCTPEEAQDEH